MKYLHRGKQRTSTCFTTTRKRILHVGLVGRMEGWQVSCLVDSLTTSLLAKRKPYNKFLMICGGVTLKNMATLHQLLDIKNYHKNI